MSKKKQHTDNGSINIEVDYSHPTATRPTHGDASSKGTIAYDIPLRLDRASVEKDIATSIKSQETGIAIEPLSDGDRHSTDSMSIKTDTTYTRVRESRFDHRSELGECSTNQEHSFSEVGSAQLTPHGMDNGYPVTSIAMPVVEVELERAESGASQPVPNNMDNRSLVQNARRTLTLEHDSALEYREPQLPETVAGSSRIFLGSPRFGQLQFSYDHTLLTDPSHSPRATDNELSFPEGGLEAWLVVFGGWCGMFGSLGVLSSLATLQAYLSEHQLASQPTGKIGWIFSVYTFLTFACGIYIGPLFDAYGPRWLVLPGSICMVLSMFLLTECTGTKYTNPEDTFDGS